MTKLARGQHGKFVAKSDEHREVRSLRLTKKVWDALGSAAEMQSVTRADLIEQLTEQGQGSLSQKELTLQQVKDAIAKIIDDPRVTRNGRDKGSVRRALETLLDSLSQPCNTR